MNATPPTLDELISAHFDDANSPEDSARLSAALAADPYAAIQFADFARTHAALAAALPQRKRAPRRALWISAATAACLALATGLAVKHWPQRSADAVVTTQVTEDKIKKAEKKTAEPARVRKVQLTAAAPLERKEDETAREFLVRQLDHFCVDFAVENADLNAALLDLWKSIKDANILRRPLFDQLSFRILPASKTAANFSIARRGISVALALELLGAVFESRVEYSEDGTYVTLVSEPVEVPLDSGGKPELKTQTFNFMGDLGSVSCLMEPICDVLNPATSKTKDGAPNPTTPAQDREMLARQFGIQLTDPGESVKCLPSAAKVVLLTHQANLVKFGRLLEALRKWTNGQIVVRTKFFSVPMNVPLQEAILNTDGVILDDAAFQSLMKSLSGMGVDLLNAPSVVTRMNQSASIEITREVGIPAPETKGSTDWVGLKVSSDNEVTGETIILTGVADFGVPPNANARYIAESLKGGSGPQWNLPPGVRPVHHRTEYALYIPDGHTAVMRLEYDDPDRILLGCWTAHKIDPAGNLILSPPRTAKP